MHKQKEDRRRESQLTGPRIGRGEPVKEFWHTAVQKLRQSGKAGPPEKSEQAKNWKLWKLFWKWQWIIKKMKFWEVVSAAELDLQCSSSFQKMTMNVGREWNLRKPVSQHSWTSIYFLRSILSGIAFTAEVVLKFQRKLENFKQYTKKCRRVKKIIIVRNL